MRHCKICNINDLDVEEPYTYPEWIEREVYFGKSFREIARGLVGYYGGDIHNWEQAIIRHCRNCADWEGWFYCLFCNATGEKLMNRFMVELMLQEGKPIGEIILTKDYFSLFENTKENPTSEKWIRRLEIHKKFCMPRYTNIRKADKENKNKSGNGVSKVASKEEKVGDAAYV